MTATKPFLAALGLGALIALPVHAQTANAHFACTYYDFNHEVQYSSKVFTSAGGNDDPAAYLGDFAAAIHAQYRVPVDARHVECHTVGEWRVDTERDRLNQLAQARDANDRVVAWPRSAS